MILLGVDPGSVILGYGAIQTLDKNSKLLEYGVLRPKLKREDYNSRLLEIYEGFTKIIQRIKPDIVSIEQMFYHKNAQTLIKLAQARAITILVAVQNKIPIVEYSPREVKKSVTGRGSASKQQVQFFVKSLLNISVTPEFYDVTDALALALCHHLKATNHAIEASSKKLKSWSDFVQQNPDRVIKK